MTLKPGKNSEEVSFHRPMFCKPFEKICIKRVKPILEELDFIPIHLFRLVNIIYKDLKKKDSFYFIKKNLPYQHFHKLLASQQLPRLQTTLLTTSHSESI